MKIKELMEILSKQDPDMDINIAYDSLVCMRDIHAIFTANLKDWSSESLIPTMVFSADDADHTMYCLKTGDEDLIEWIYGETDERR